MARPISTGWGGLSGLMATRPVQSRDTSDWFRLTPRPASTMCPGGQVFAAASEPGGVVTNGMGGGNSALQDAVMLAEKSSRVYLIHRRAEFRGEEQLVERLRKMRSVEFVLESRITALHGEGTLTGITVENVSGRTRELAVDGLFVAVGREPVNGAFADYLALDAGGYALSGEDCLTKTPGVFVAGDCRAKKVRQLTTAAADGSVAALAACAYIDSAD